MIIISNIILIGAIKYMCRASNFAYSSIIDSKRMMKDNAYRKIFERFGRLNEFGYCYIVKIIDVSSNRDSAISFTSTTMKVYSPHNPRRCERNNNDRNSPDEEERDHFYFKTGTDWDELGEIPF